MGLAVVESGWGSILPTVVVANLLHGGPAERCGELSIGDRIMSINGTSMVGLPITTCQNIIRVRGVHRGVIMQNLITVITISIIIKSNYYYAENACSVYLSILGSFTENALSIWCTRWQCVSMLCEHTRCDLMVNLDIN